MEKTNVDKSKEKKGRTQSEPEECQRVKSGQETVRRRRFC